MEEKKETSGLVFIGQKGAELANRVEVTVADIKKFIAPKASDQELYMFVQIARSQGLNPFAREIHFVAFKDKQTGELHHSIVVGYEVYLKRVLASGLCEGFKIEMRNEGTDKEEAVYTGYRKGWKEPFEWAVKTSVYHKHQSIWNVNPRHMIQKIAVSQGMRLQFADAIGGMPYTNEEIVAGGQEVQAEFSAVDDNPKTETGSISLEDLTPAESPAPETASSVPEEGTPQLELGSEPETGIPWKKIFDLPASKLTEGNVEGVLGMMDYPEDDPKKIKPLLKSGHFKLALARLQAWEKEKGGAK